MARSSAKKLAKANAARLRTLQLVILFINVLYGLVRGVLLRATFRNTHAIAWGVLSVVYALSYGFLHSSARPTLEDGKIVDGGEDIGSSGVMEYVHDLIYITVIVQFGCIFSNFALLGFLVVPVFACYALFAARSAAAPLAEDVDTKQAELAMMSRKERRKHERQARKTY